MKIEGTGSMNGRTMPVMGAQDTDPESRAIQARIKEKQEELRKLSEDSGMSLEQKMKKRQEIQQEISDLNNQLRQHQMEQRRAQQEKKASMDDMLGGTQTAPAKTPGKKQSGFSEESVQVIISADATVKMADAKSGIATELHGEGNILESEIKQDKVQGINTEKKEADLAKIRANESDTKASQISDLAKANEAMKEAAEADEAKDDTEEKEKDEEDQAVEEENAKIQE